MLSTFATLSVNSAKHLDAHADRPFAAAQGDTVRQRRLMRIGRPKGIDSNKIEIPSLTPLSWPKAEALAHTCAEHSGRSRVGAGLPVARA